VLLRSKYSSLSCGKYKKTTAIANIIGVRGTSSDFNSTVLSDDFLLILPLFLGSVRRQEK